MIGCTRSQVNNVIGGCGTSRPTRMLIEIILGIPIWSTPEAFHALTQHLRREALKISQSNQPDNPKYEKNEK